MFIIFRYFVNRMTEEMLVVSISRSLLRYVLFDMYQSTCILDDASVPFNRAPFTILENLEDSSDIQISK